MGVQGRRLPRLITKRAGARLALLLLLGGAIVNVAVAWGMTIRPPHEAFNMGQEIDAAAMYRRYCPRDRVDTASMAVGISGMRGIGRITYVASSCETGGGYRCGVWESQFGLPMMALSCGSFHTSIAGPVMQSRTDVLWLDPRRDRYLPVGMIWPGFAINTAFYAAVLWLLFAAPFALRRRRRIKRGLCPKCAYDLRGSAADATACPECGAPR